MASPDGRSPSRTRRRPGAAPGDTACSKTFTISGLTDAPGRTSTGLDADPGSISPTAPVSGLPDPCVLLLGIVRLLVFVLATEGGDARAGAACVASGWLRS